MMLLRRLLYSPFIVVLLLLCHFMIRTHNIDVQQPYVDEGFHLSRAVRVWDFAENPGRFAHGKVLVYFWMGMFEAENTLQTMLPVGRLSLALFSVITGAGLYLLGRLLASHLTGVFAIAIYACLPLAFFYERMALADALASGLICLSVWRSWVFARRPSFKEGAILGVLLALCTLAKLTVVPVTLLPVGAALIYYPWKRGALLPQIAHGFRVYLPPLVLAAAIVIMFWLPMVIPALQAHGTPERFTLVDDAAVADTNSDGYFLQPLRYLSRITPMMAEFVSPVFLLAAALSLMGGLAFFRRVDRHLWCSLLLVGWWLILITTLTLFIARIHTMRYFMPTAAPLSLIVAIGTAAILEGRFSKSASQLSAKAVPSPQSAVPSPQSAVPSPQSAVPSLQQSTLSLHSLKAKSQKLKADSAPYTILHFSVLLGILFWFFGWSLPFLQQTWAQPHQLPFTDTNRTEYVAGYFLGDAAVQAAAAHLNMLPPRPVYVSWNLCHLLLFYADMPLNCLPFYTPRATLTRYLKALPTGEKVYLLMADYDPFWEKIENANWQILAQYDRALIKRPVYLLEIGLTP
jgi:hypothetical protein